MLSITRKEFTRAFLGTAILLLIPLFGNVLSNEVNWKVGDFLVGGVLILMFFISLAMITRIKTSGLKIAVMVLLILSFILIWAELAVGVFGTPFAGS